jgi:DNA invertase Pin-like site-specific DNA recombinase
MNCLCSLVSFERFGEVRLWSICLNDHFNMNVIYLRVSKEELDENTQLPEILKCFPKLNNYKILQEKVSAYKEKDQKNRVEFIKLKCMIEKGEVDNLYVYSLERLERNIIRMFEFYFFCEANGCRIHGALQPSLELDFEDNPVGTFSRYQQVLMFGLLGENESYLTSQRTRKSVRIKEGVTLSKNGNKWGKKLKDSKGNYVELSARQYINLKKYIKQNITLRQDRIVDLVEKKYTVKVSKAFITGVKNG